MYVVELPRFGVLVILGLGFRGLGLGVSRDSASGVGSVPVSLKKCIDLEGLEV